MGSIREHETRSDLRADIEDQLRAASDMLAVSTPAAALSWFEPHLRAAIDRDVLVLLLISGGEPSDEDLQIDRLATITRRFDDHLPAMGFVDGNVGWTGDYRLLLQESVPDRAVTVFSNTDMAHAVYSAFLGVHWEPAMEVSVVDPRPLPSTYSRFQRAVIDATLRMRAEQPLEATATGRNVDTGETVTVSGPIVNSRQSYVYPITAEIYGTNGLVVETDDGSTCTLGGHQAYLEHIEVEELTLRAVESA